MNYIELLSGSGLCKIRDTNDIVVGSAIIAATMCYKPFTNYYLIEKDEIKADVLEKRMKTINQNVTVIRGDCNESLLNLNLKFEEKDHYLAFVDCEGLEVNWSTLSLLLKKPGDLLFNFQSSMVPRVVGRANGGSAGDTIRLNLFYGDDRWKSYKSPDELLGGYMEKIRTQTNRKRVLSLPVKGPKSYRYDLILATRETKGGNPWLKPMEDLSETLDHYGPKFIEIALDILMGRQGTLDAYI